MSRAELISVFGAAAGILLSTRLPSQDSTSRTSEIAPRTTLVPPSEPFNSRTAHTYKRELLANLTLVVLLDFALDFELLSGYKMVK